MWDFIKNAPILMWVFGAALAAAAWLVTDLALTKNALEDSREEAAKYEHIIEVTERIEERDTVIVRATDRASDAIKETPNADQPISPDVAAAWAAGIDSVRDAATQPPGKHDVSRPDGRDAKSRNAD